MRIATAPFRWVRVQTGANRLWGIVKRERFLSIKVPHGAEPPGVNVFDKASPSKLYKTDLRHCRLRQAACRDALGMESWHEILCVCNRDGFDRGRAAVFRLSRPDEEWVARITAISDGHLRKVGLALMAVGLWLVYMGGAEGLKGSPPNRRIEKCTH